MQKLHFGQAAVEQVCIRNFAARLEQLQQATEHESLARSHFSGHNDHALVPNDAIVESGQRLIVPLRRYKTCWIRR